MISSHHVALVIVAGTLALAACGEEQPHASGDPMSAANGSGTNTTSTANSTATTGNASDTNATVNAGTTASSGNGAMTTTASTSAAVTAGSMSTAGSGGAAAMTTGGVNSSTSTGASVGGSGGTSATAAGGASSETTGSGTGGTGVVADPGCGSHKWACWPMPNMPGSGLPNEASYTDNGDGTVTDNLTQLVWQSEQPDESFTWQQAIGYCEGLSLAGVDDWRLPTRIEVTSVLDHSDGHTGWAAEAFSGARSGFHHTGSEWVLRINDATRPDFSWGFNASDGMFSNAFEQSGAYSLRCVRGGGSGEGPSQLAEAPPNQYTLIAEGEALDNYTGLIWQRGDTDEMVSWQQAVEYCDSLALNGNSWRLPSIREISTLVDEAEVAPSINSEVFPDTHYGSHSNNWYWATPERGSAAWAINFDDGFTGTNTGSASWNTFGPAWAKCVR